MDRSLTRRDFMSASGRVAGGLGLSLLGNALVLSPVYAGGADDFGPLQPPYANGLQLPPGFGSRVVAISGQPVGGTGFRWHVKPDGGAVFVTDSGGWIYVSNSEEESSGGGVGAIEFDADGAHLILGADGGFTANLEGADSPR